MDWPGEVKDDDGVRGWLECLHTGSRMERKSEEGRLVGNPGKTEGPEIRIGSRSGWREDRVGKVEGGEGCLYPKGSLASGWLQRNGDGSDRNGGTQGIVRSPD